MDLRCYLAMTAAEFQFADTLPSHVAWMACHFSSYGTGLTNIPHTLPPGSILIINDRTPAHGHDPALILEQLETCIEPLAVGGVLLDFQRPNSPEVLQIAKLLTAQLSCPIAVTPCYATDLSCGVFLPPPPLHVPLSSHISPWGDREIWLEVALENQKFVVTAEGSNCEQLPFDPLKEPCFQDHALHCQYHINVLEEQAVFTLSRDPSMLRQLMEEASTSGAVTHLIGLYQQLQSVNLTSDKNILAN